MSALVLLPFLTAAAVQAAPPAPRPHPTVMVRAQWLKRIGLDTVLRYYPSAALRAGQGGDVVLSCTITVEGLAKDCVVASESGAGSGFGDAAVAMSPAFRFRPFMVNGVPEQTRVRLPLRFVAAERPYVDQGDPVEPSIRP